MATQALLLTLRARSTATVVAVNQDKSAEYRNDEKQIKLGNSFPYGEFD